MDSVSQPLQQRSHAVAIVLLFIGLQKSRPSLNDRGCVTSGFQNSSSCGDVLPFGSSVHFQMRLQPLVSSQLCHTGISNDISDRHKWVFSLCPVSRVRHQPSSPLSLGETSLPCPPSPYCLPLSHVHFGGALPLTQSFVTSV